MWISPRHRLVEAATGALFPAAAAVFDRRYPTVLLALSFAVMLSVAVIVAEGRMIPNRIMYPSLLLFAAPLRWGRPLASLWIRYPGSSGSWSMVGGLCYVAVAVVVAILGGGLGASVPI